ncbi:MscL family protein [Mycoplasma sp. 4404]|uniref:large conductance mechanosensitive channel protein MscL n=1 Tax=Mycoplasma sp. 4404 TaxID=3108530 RepID=UPI002B1E7B8C|nr:MscL family protein [Mycoplasma sp. 4404]MEA4162444.1 MscL family protein [Mycoplasma sp. 4404]
MSKKSSIFKKSLVDAKNNLKRGNILLLAIAFILGAVFSALVASLANDIIMNPISKLLGFDELAKMESNGVLYGKFLAALLTFIIVSFVVFAILFGYFLIANAIAAHKAAKRPVVAEAPAKPTTEELILKELVKLNDKMDKK